MKTKSLKVSKELWLILNQIKLDKDLGTMNDVINDLITRIKFLEDCKDYVKQTNEVIVESCSITDSDNLLEYKESGDDIEVGGRKIVLDEETEEEEHLPRLEED